MELFQFSAWRWRLQEFKKFAKSEIQNEIVLSQLASKANMWYLILLALSSAAESKQNQTKKIKTESLKWTAFLERNRCCHRLTLWSFCPLDWLTGCFISLFVRLYILMQLLIPIHSLLSYNRSKVSICYLRIDTARTDQFLVVWSLESVW